MATVRSGYLPMYWMAQAATLCAHDLDPEITGDDIDCLAIKALRPTTIHRLFNAFYYWDWSF